MRSCDATTSSLDQLRGPGYSKAIFKVASTQFRMNGCSLIHPGKSRTWCYRKYLTRIGSRGYVLQGSYLDRRGKPHLVRLANASDIPIKRHIKVKAAANPYDSIWESYFEERLA